MKIKHYRAADMRQALRLVREAQGPDAVILSSRKVNGGVEVVAAVDYDDEEVVGGSRFAVSQKQEASREGPAAAYANLARSAPASRQPPTADRFEPESEDSRPDVNEELRTLRRMLETQLATLAWNDLARRSPVQTELLRELTELGLAHDLAGEIAVQLPARADLSETRRLALALLARRIETVEERWLNTGGVVAAMGPTGVGKTTLIAKLAARWVLRHGPRDLALISTDSVRIGAQDQIQTLGRLLGAPAYAVDGAGELPALLGHLSERRLILIDTGGMSPRDERLPDELDLLSSASSRIECALVLSAAAQAGAIEEAIERYSLARPASAVLTKLDEATSLGGAMSALIRCKLPLAYLSDGQRVPEDLNAARAHQLIARAVELSRKAGATADEDLLQRRFGAVAHAMA